MASRVATLAAKQIAERLDDCFQVLVGGTRVGPVRQQTVAAATNWSYDLLTPVEQVTFGSLSTFAGGFDLEAVEAVRGGRANDEQRGTSGDSLRPRRR